MNIVLRFCFPDLTENIELYFFVTFKQKIVLPFN